MGRRLQDLYQPGDRVEISFAAAAGAWQPATVLRHQPPGMWVATADGRAWFVTNAKRVRFAAAPPDSPSTT